MHHAVSFIPHLKTLLILALPFLGALTASAHLTYTGRDFGTFTLANPRSMQIAGQTTKAFGWADGTDADFARQDDQRYFKFTLDSTITITITITADPALMLPAFTIYSGFGHWVTDAANPDYDGAVVTDNYLKSLGAPQPREGAFDALHTFKIGNDSKPETGYVAELVTLTYIDHAADGTAANYGSTPGIKGDGLANGTVTATFTLPSGNYTMAVAGANYTSTDATSRAFTTTIQQQGAPPIPEPSSALLIATGAAALGAFRQRRTSAPRA